MNPVDFYDRMSPFYHLIFPAGFDTSIQRHGEMLQAIIQTHWGTRVQSILDVSCGIGTQALGLSQRGYAVTGSDLSPGAIERARREAQGRGLHIDFSVADMRQAFSHHHRQFDLVLAADNSVSHLLTDAKILTAFEQFYQCCRPGGGCLITVRDYDNEERIDQVRPYGLRAEGEVRYLIIQTWAFDGPIYEISMYFVQDDGSAQCTTHVMRTHYYAIGITRLMELMQQAGFSRVQKLDEAFFQPVIIGTRPN